MNYPLSKQPGSYKCLALALLLLLGPLINSALCANLSGIWRGLITDPGGNTHELTFNFKADNNKLTGTVTGPEPLDSTPTIENGIIQGDQIAFAVNSKDPNGNLVKFTFTLQVTDHQIQGVIADQREGRSFPLTAARAGAAIRGPQSTNVNGSNQSVVPGMVVVPPANLPGSNPTPEAAQTAVLAAFAQYEVVGLGVLSYANQDFNTFILTLIRNPAFAGMVNDIAVEYGNSLYQPVLDRYIAGEEVSLSEVRAVWRNTTQPRSGFSGFYENLFPLVRQINRQLPHEKKLRMLACDSPVNWTKVKREEDMKPFEDRDRNIASVMEKEVLMKRRRALMIFGVRHLMHGGGGAVAMYERNGYPNVTFVIAAHNGFTGPAKHVQELESRLASWPVPSLVSLKVKGTWLANLDRAYLFPDEKWSKRISEIIDGYLYLGPPGLLLDEPIPADVVLDKAYMTELGRRADVTGGPRPESILQEATQSKVLFNRPEK